MAAIGFHASHEQIPPSVLLRAVAEAEAAGFERAWSSDHFSPWSERQGESDKAVRNARLRECVDVIRALFAGEAADHDGLITINQPRETLERVVAAFREHGGEGKPVAVQVYLHHVGQDQRRFIDVFGEHVLPAL